MTISTNTTPQYMNNDSFVTVETLAKKIGMAAHNPVNTGPAVSQTLNCLSTLDKNVNKIGSYYLLNPWSSSDSFWWTEYQTHATSNGNGIIRDCCRQRELKIATSRPFCWSHWQIRWRQVIDNVVRWEINFQEAPKAWQKLPEWREDSEVRSLRAIECTEVYSDTPQMFKLWLKERFRRFPNFPQLRKWLD